MNSRVLCHGGKLALSLCAVDNTKLRSNFFREPVTRQLCAVAPVRFRYRHGTCTPTWASASQGPADEFRQRLGEAVNEAKRIVIGFGREHKLGEKAAAAWENGNKGVENLCEDVRKRSVEFERRYELRSRSRVAAAQVRSKLAEIDKAYDVRSNWERFLAYAQINLPKARRRVQMAYATPLGKIILVLLLGWMLASGFFFEILNFMFVVMMLGPFFLPPFMQWWLKNNTVRGACPSCGTKYFGRKDRKHICATCRAVVWKPRDDYMDNGTIDVEVGPVPA